MKTKCVAYTINETYLLPTLLSAVQARETTARDIDIVIVCFGPQTDTTRIFADLSLRYGIVFMVAPVARLEGMPLLCARFFLSDLLAAHYLDIVYVDGDTQVSGPLDDLANAAFAPGRLLATPDPMAIMLDRSTRDWISRRRYFLSIGLAEAHLPGYFNSGVLRFRRGDWEAISRECLRVCKAKAGQFRFLDQDALNLVVGDNRLPLSFKWNFPSFFLNCGVEGEIRPRVYHFMSNPRPWQGAFQPWGRPRHDVYRQLTVDHPELQRFLKPLTPVRHLKYVLQQHYKRLAEARLWNTPPIRERITRFEELAFI